MNPQDVWDISASTSSINHMVDEGKPIYGYRGSPPAPSNLNPTYYLLPSEPEADRGSITHQESGAGSSSATVRGNELVHNHYSSLNNAVLNSQIPTLRPKIASLVKTEVAQATRQPLHLQLSHPQGRSRDQSTTTTTLKTLWTSMATIR